MNPEIPVACTLSAADYRKRLAEIATLSQESLRSVERRGLTIDLRYAPEAAERVRTLVEQERQCCTFLQFDLDEDEVCLRVTAPPAAADAVPELLAALMGLPR